MSDSRNMPDNNQQRQDMMQQQQFMNQQQMQQYPNPQQMQQYQQQFDPQYQQYYQQQYQMQQSQDYEQQMMQGMQNMNMRQNQQGYYPNHQQNNRQPNQNARGARSKQNNNQGQNQQNMDGEQQTGKQLAIACNPQLKEVNPTNFKIPDFARFFVIKSQSEDDVHKSIKQGVWASTKSGNEKIDAAFRESCQDGPTYLFFSVNASGQFLGVCEMDGGVDFNKKFQAWAQENKWHGQFKVKWVFTKDIPNKEFRNIILENNDNKPVTNSRDTQEVPLKQGLQILKIFSAYRNTTTIMDDFGQYDKRQGDMEVKRGITKQFN